MASRMMRVEGTSRNDKYFKFHMEVENEVCVAFVYINEDNYEMELGIDHDSFTEPRRYFFPGNVVSETREEIPEHLRPSALSIRTSFAYPALDH